MRVGFPFVKIFLANLFGRNLFGDIHDNCPSRLGVIDSTHEREETRQEKVS